MCTVCLPTAYMHMYICLYINVFFCTPRNNNSIVNALWLSLQCAHEMSIVQIAGTLYSFSKVVML